MLWIVFWIICGVFTAMIAGTKGRSGAGWFWLGVLFGPFALLFVSVMPRDERTIAAEEVKRGTLRKCPMCAETVKVEAIKCKHCGADLPEVIISAKPVEQPRTLTKQCKKCGGSFDYYAQTCPHCAT